MKIYCQNGMIYNECDYEKYKDGFYVQENSVDTVNKYSYLGDKIRLEIDSELVLLYDTLRDLFFENINQYYCEVSIMPSFVQTAGQDSDCAMTAELFSKYIKDDKSNYKQIDLYKHLYLVDCQYLVGTIQNLLDGINDSLINYFVRLPNIGNEIITTKDNVVMKQMSQEVSCISSILESYFTKAYSILDMFCKIVYELEYAISDFSSYKKLKSADKLWGDRKHLEINNTVQTIFEKCDLIRSIEALRNEVVHNGSWELRPKAFVVFENAKIVERFMLFPDIEEGHLVTVKNRKHFFASGNKVNEVLPKMHIEYMKRILYTARLLNKKYSKNI